jgi:hypothetical protein
MEVFDQSEATSVRRLYKRTQIITLLTAVATPQTAGGTSLLQQLEVRF